MGTAHCEKTQCLGSAAMIRSFGCPSDALHAFVKALGTAVRGGWEMAPNNVIIFPWFAPLNH